MRVTLRQFTLLTLFSIAISLGTSVQAQTRPYRVTDRQVQILLNRIETRTDTFKIQVERALDNSSADGTRREDTINMLVSDFESATDQLTDNFSSRRSTTGDVDEVLRRAGVINSFIRSNRISTPVDRSWTLIRTDLTTLARYYRATANWNSNVYVPVASGVYSGTDTQLRTLLASIESRTNRFKRQIERNLNNSSVDGTNREDSINAMVANFENATDRLRVNFTARRSTANDVQDVLNKAVSVNRFVENNRLATPAEVSWREIKTDLDTLAGYYRVSTNWNAVVPGGGNVYTVSDTELRNLLNSIESRTNTFKRQIERNLNNSSLNGTNREDSINTMVGNFEDATDRLKNNFIARRSTTSDVQEVLDRAVGVNRFVENNRLSPAAENSWRDIRADIDTLAGYYRVSSNWNAPVILPGNQSGSFDSRLTGTYRLNRAQSDDVKSTVENAISHANYGNADHERLHRNLERRLESPETLMFEKRGQQVTMAAANAQSVVLTANGTRQNETSAGGRPVTTSVMANNSELTINYEGDRINDYYVSFMPLGNGQLRVTRRVYLENQNSTVTVMSVYDKTSQTAQFDNYPANTGGTVLNGFIVPNSTSIVATLDSNLSTRTAKDGDRFSMTVNSPSQYYGAVIEGRVIGERSGVVSGRATMSLSFDSIRMRDGRIYNFAGIVDQVRDADGDVIKVNNEGTIRDSSQTNKTIKRAGIGAILGAIIGAVVDGGSGAAIGAGVGAGAGAGTVVLQGRDNLELASGSQFMITATAPSSVGTR